MIIGSSQIVMNHNIESVTFVQNTAARIITISKKIENIYGEEVVEPVKQAIENDPSFVIHGGVAVNVRFVACISYSRTHGVVAVKMTSGTVYHMNQDAWTKFMEKEKNGYDKI